MEKSNYDFGDYVEILTDEKKFLGTLIPSVNKDVYVLKLDSGYNIGINKNKVKKISLIKKNILKKENIGKIVQKKNLHTISILHTGGTISSRIDYKTGAVTSVFTPEELIAMFPELKDIANFRSKLIRKMWSDDLRFKHFGILAKEIEKEIKEDVKGIIIGIGTDNLAVAASALSFALESCPVPVILVGAQRSSDRGSSDAYLNLLSASLFIAKTDFSGVAICMHENLDDKNCLIMPACKTRKLHTSRRDAFKVVNDKPIARVNYKTKNIEFLKQKYSKRNEKLIIKDKFEEKVGLIKITINMNSKQFKAYHGYKGLI